MKAIKITLLIGISLCFASSIDPDMYFLEVVPADTPPRRITSNYWNVLVAPATSIEITIIYPDRPPYKINLADQQGYCGNAFDKKSDRLRDILAYGRVVNRD